ncbi:dephospho-CoA kinase [Caminibacter mediatlanticus TB-2]|uniref:Dephospho-CoA kinase n=1 Tax=Caminibacter mediatlanticus TB-2 TaxID=391592 RepID=A0AAI9AHK5_9BACT|nr:dephospho-CoA kinase [Caminibacter mediatlanticus TB-2]
MKFDIINKKGGE